MVDRRFALFGIRSIRQLDIALAFWLASSACFSASNSSKVTMSNSVSEVSDHSDPPGQALATHRVASEQFVVACILLLRTGWVTHTTFDGHDPSAACRILPT